MADPKYLSLTERVLLDRYRSAPPAVPTAPEKQWWNLPAKVNAGRRIADEERRNHTGHHNDHGDGMRHATWSRRMAEEVGPGFSALAGVEHEIEGLVRKGPDGRRQPLSEAAMDIANNFEGLRAWAQRRAVDPAKIRDRPVAFGPY